MKRLPALIALSILALALAACGETVIDSAKTEDAIESNLEKSTGATIESVDCPSDVEVEPKTTFECTVTQGGEEQVAVLQILNDDADVSLINLHPAGAGDDGSANK